MTCLPSYLAPTPQSPAVVERAASLVREIAEGSDTAAKWVPPVPLLGAM